MTDEIRNLHKLSPSFVISAGTQVVLKVSKTLADGEYRKPGTVGVVVRSPSSNREPYTVQFADGQSAPAYFDELVLRRKEIEAELGMVQDDLRPYIIYRCQVGSKAFGLAGDDADDDLRGIYLPPARLDWSLYALPEQIESQAETHDEVYWELEKFLLLALKANPNVLETLWTPLVLHSTPLPTNCGRCGRRSSRSTCSRRTRATSSASFVEWPRRCDRAGPTSPSTRCT